MNFYPHHIKDFNFSTRHLTRVERSVYRDSIELYYDTESPLTTDVATLQRKLLCVSDEEKTALKTVLSEYFVLTESGYTHERCEIEIEKYRANTTAKAKAGIASAEARKLKSAQRQQIPTGVEQGLTSAQLTNNQEPITNKAKARAKAPLALTRFAEFWGVYPRRADKAKAELAWSKYGLDAMADTVIAGAKAYAKSKAGSEPQFIALPTTWLNGKRWQDEEGVAAPQVVELTDDQKAARIRDEQAERRLYEREHLRRNRELLGEQP